MRKTELFFIRLNDFFEYLKLELKSEKTIRTYKEGLESFKNYLNKDRHMNIEKITFDDIDADLIRQFLKNLMDSGYALSTRNIKLVAIKEYIRYCADKDITILPLQLKMSKIKTKKVVPKKHNWICRNQVELLLEQTARNKIGIRDRFIMFFLFSTGMRLSEMLECRLKDTHIDFVDPYVLVIGKGNKTRVIPLTDEVVDNIRTYISIFHKNSSLESYLIYTVHDHMNHKMSEDNVQRIVNKYAALARNEDTDFPALHPHMLRHSFGAIMYRNNMSKAEIAKLMGHEQESTTEIYVETDVEMIRKSLMRLNDSQSKDKFKDLNEEEKCKVMGSY